MVGAILCCILTFFNLSLFNLFDIFKIGSCVGCSVEAELVPTSISVDQIK